MFLFVCLVVFWLSVRFVLLFEASTPKLALKLRVNLSSCGLPHVGIIHVRPTSNYRTPLKHSNEKGGLAEGWRKTESKVKPSSEDVC